MSIDERIESEKSRHYEKIRQLYDILKMYEDNAREYFASIERNVNQAVNYGISPDRIESYEQSRKETIPYSKQIKEIEAEIAAENELHEKNMANLKKEKLELEQKRNQEKQEIRKRLEEEQEKLARMLDNIEQKRNEPKYEYAGKRNKEEVPEWAKDKGYSINYTNIENHGTVSERNFDDIYDLEIRKLVELKKNNDPNYESELNNAIRKISSLTDKISDIRGQIESDIRYELGVAQKSQATNQTEKDDGVQKITSFNKSNIEQMSIETVIQQIKQQYPQVMMINANGTFEYDGQYRVDVITNNNMRTSIDVSKDVFDRLEEYFSQKPESIAIHSSKFKKIDGNQLNKEEKHDMSNVQQDKAKNELVNKIIGAMNMAGELAFGNISIGERMSIIQNVREKLNAKSIDELQMLLSTYQQQNVQEENVDSKKHR